MKKVLAITLFSLLGICSCDTSVPHNRDAYNKELVSTGALLCGHLLNSPKYMMYQTDFLNSVHYAEVCAAYGALQFETFSDSLDLLNSLLDRYRPLETDSIAWQNHHVDGNVYGILPFQLYQKTGDSTFLKHGLFMADTQWENPLPNGMTRQTRYWIDDVFMVSSLQIEAFKATNDPKYLDRAALFTASYVDSLQQENGLFFHGPEAPIHWGRGNGWMAVGMAATLRELPIGHPHYDLIVSGYTKMMENLVNYQGENGMWRQVIDLPDAWDESSCTAMFAYAMSVGINRGILSDEKYNKAVMSAWVALQKAVNEKGELMNVCAGTGQSKEISYYLDRPRINGDFHGQGTPALADQQPID